MEKICKTFRFSDGDFFEADIDKLKALLVDNKAYLLNYQEVLSSLDDDEFVARGNGFCDRKYSDDFIESQIRKYESRIADLERWISEMSED